MIRARIALLALLCTAACTARTARERASDGRVPEATSRTASAIIGGTDSDASQDAVVLVMHYDALQVGGASAGCTGTLLAPNLVLTARHCVAVTDGSAACDENGNATFGGAIRSEHAPSKLYAFSGSQRPDFLAGLEKGARGLEILDDDAKTLCNHDIALLLLDRPLAGGKRAPVRLDGGPRLAESVRVVGWGVTEKSANPPARQQRGGVKVLAIGPGPRLGPAEFRVTESGCAGDSGGPAFSEETGALLGVLSRGGNADEIKPEDPSSGCLGAENVFTSAAKYKDLVSGAYARAGHAPWLEGQPEPTAASGAEAPAPVDDEGSGCAVAAARSRVLSADTSAAWLRAVAGIAACVACFVRRRARS